MDNTPQVDQSIEIAQAFLDAVNVYSFDEAQFADQITRAHRTLQQSAMRAFLACIQQWGVLPAGFDAHPHAYDARNEATVLLCRRIVAALGDNTRLPLI